MVHSQMVGLCGVDGKVCQVIVALIAVFVMDDLFAGQRVVLTHNCAGEA